MAPWRKTLALFVADMQAMYGSRLNCVLLYGSRARGDDEEGSDIDTLVVLDPSGDFWAEFNRISPVASRLSLEHDLVISALPVDLRTLGETDSPFLRNVRAEGVRVG